MLHEITGNLLDFPNNINIIVHQANCQNTFGAGIAAQIKKRYPEAFEADTKFYRKSIFVEEDHTVSFLMGNISHCKLDAGKYIVNLYAQNLGSGKKRATNYEAFAQGLERLVEFCSSHPVNEEPVIGFPKFIGCGLGKASWNIIKAMIEDFQISTGHEVIIVNYKPQVSATLATKSV